MTKTIRMTVAQAIVKFLDNQYVSMDGEETKFVEGFFTIFGHGIAVGLGEALDTDPGQLRVLQGRNEQGMCHVATAFAKQSNRKKIIPCASSVGPGAANMVTACATATVNNIPLLVFPADTFASRQPDPVLQQLEQSNSLATTTNDAFKPVCKYWDRITRPEMIMTALINAMRVLTDPAETGACCIALCQDVEGESYDYPEYFFQKRVHRITRPVAVEEELEDLAEIIAEAKKPLVIVGGGVRYSEAGETVEKFCEEFKIPFGESQAGKSACKSSHPYCLGGIGVTGTYASNIIAEDADVVIAIGSRMSDFTTTPFVVEKWFNTATFDAKKVRQFIIDIAVKDFGLVLNEEMTIDDSSWFAPLCFPLDDNDGQLVKVRCMSEPKIVYDMGHMKKGDSFNVIIKYVDAEEMNTLGGVGEGYVIFYLR